MEIVCTQFQGNRFRIDGEIDEKHALQIYQNNCVLDYHVLVDSCIYGYKTLSCDMIYIDDVYCQH